MLCFFTTSMFDISFIPFPNTNIKPLFGGARCIVQSSFLKILVYLLSFFRLTDVVRFSIVWYILDIFLSNMWPHLKCKKKTNKQLNLQFVYLAQHFCCNKVFLFLFIKVLISSSSNRLTHIAKYTGRLHF